MCKNRYKQTKFDCMVTNETMQLMKAVIPYIDGPISNLLEIMRKFKELENASFINSNIAITTMNENHSKSTENMLSDIMEFMDEDTKESIENIKSMMEMMDMFKDMDTADIFQTMDDFSSSN